MPEEKRICGYCVTADCDKCRPVIRWFDKEWYCNCECQQEREENK